MKQIFVVFLMTFSMSIYAGNSLEKEDVKVTPVELENLIIKSNDEKNTSPVGYIVTCYVTISNSETGETRRVDSFGHGATRSAALANCGSNARVVATFLVESLNR